MTKRFLACIIFILLYITPPASAQTLEFQKVFEQHGVVMMLIDPNTGAIVDANPAAAQFYGHERDKLKTMTIQQINTLSAAQVAEERTLAQNEGRNYFIFRHRLADGEIRTVEVHSNPFTIAGRPLLLSLIHDITPGRNLEQGMWHYQQRLEELVEARTAEIKFKHLMITLILIGSLLIVSIIAIMLLRGIARRQRIELDLRQSEERYRLAQEATGVGIWDWDVVNDHLCWDDRMWAMVGYPPDNRRISYTDWRSLLHPEDLASADQEVKKQVHLGQGFVIEFRLRTKDGGWRWVQGRGKVVARTDDGAPCRMMGTHTDIHERKQAEQQISELNRDFIAFLENTTDFIYFKDKLSRFRFCSQTMANITGHAHWRDMVGKHDLEVFPAETAQIYYEEELPIFREGLPLLNKIDPYFDSSGNKRWVSTNKWPLLDKGGEVAGLFGISRDITERKQVEAKLLELNMAVEQSDDGVALTDMDEHIVFVNKAWADMHGYAAEELIGQHLNIFHTPEQLVNEVIPFNGRLIATGSKTGEMGHCRKDGTTFIAQMAVTVVKDTTDTPFRLLAAARDITERKHAQDLLKQQKIQLEQRNRALRQFNYAVSHELKTPLVTIESSLGLIHGTLRETMDPGLTKIFGYARNATKQMHNLLESLLLIFRIDTADSGPAAIEFKMLAQDAVDRLSKGSRLQNIKVTITAEGPELYGDRHKLVQIWLQLIENAAKYMGDQKDPAIDIGFAQTDQEVQFYVRDNGMGIEEQYQGKIFEFYDQLNKTAVGTGLGLTLVQRIVDYYGGTIRVESGGTNQGSCFYFTLPDALI